MFSHTFREYTSKVSQLCDLYPWRYDHVCIGQKYDSSILVDMCVHIHIASVLIYYGTATSPQCVVKINISRCWVSWFHVQFDPL